MNLARIVYSLTVVVGALWFPVRGLAADGIGERIRQAEERAEKELEHTAETDPSHGNPNTDPLSIDPDLAICTVIVFVLLLAVLWKFAWGPILAGLEKREHSIANEISSAQRQHEEAKALVVQYEARLAAAGEEVRALLDEARRDADHARQGILADAKSAAEAERLRALHDIEAATDGALRSLAERSAQLAVELAGKIVRHNLTPADHSRLVDEAVQQFTVTPSKN